MEDKQIVFRATVDEYSTLKGIAKHPYDDRLIRAPYHRRHRTISFPNRFEDGIADPDLLNNLTTD